MILDIENPWLDVYKSTDKSNLRNGSFASLCLPRSSYSITPFERGGPLESSGDRERSINLSRGSMKDRRISRRFGKEEEETISPICVGFAKHSVRRVALQPVLSEAWSRRTEGLSIIFLFNYDTLRCLFKRGLSRRPLVTDTSAIVYAQ